MAAGEVKFNTPFGEIALTKHRRDKDDRDKAIAEFAGNLTIGGSAIAIRYKCERAGESAWKVTCLDDERDRRTFVVTEETIDIETDFFADPRYVRDPKGSLREAFNAIMGYLTEALARPNGFEWMMFEQRMWNHTYASLESE